MSIMRSRIGHRATSAVMSAALVAGALAGCSGHGGGARPAPIGSKPPAGQPTGDEPGATATAPPGGLRRAFAAMPADYDVVGAIDLTRIRASAIYRTYEPRLRAAIDGELADLQKDCGFDLLDTMSGVMFGARGEEAEHATIIVNGLERTATNRCLERRIASKRLSEPTARWVADGDYVEYAEADPEDGLRMRWLGSRTVLIIKDGDDAAGPRALAAAATARDGAGLSGSPAFMDLVARSRTDAAVWFIARGERFGSVPGLPQLRAVRGAFDAVDGVKGDLRLTLPSAGEARTLADQFNGELGSVRASPMASLVTDVTIRAEDADVVIAIALSPEQLEQLAGLIGAFSP